MAKKKKAKRQKPADNSIAAAEVAKPDSTPTWLVPYRWKPGQSGNPSGPRVGLSGEIKNLTGGGMEMVHTMLRIMRGERIPGVWGTPTYNHVQEAAVWLAEQCFGRAPFKIKDDDGTYDLQRLLYVELSRRKDESGVFDISDEKLLEQGLADQQSLQDPHEKPRPRKV